MTVYNLQAVLSRVKRSSDESTGSVARKEDVNVAAASVGRDVPQARVGIHVVAQGSAVLGVGDAGRGLVVADGIATEVLGAVSLVEGRPAVKSGGVDGGGGVEAVVDGDDGRGYPVEVEFNAQEDRDGGRKLHYGSGSGG